MTIGHWQESQTVQRKQTVGVRTALYLAPDISSSIEIGESVGTVGVAVGRPVGVAVGPIVVMYASLTEMISVTFPHISIRIMLATIIMPFQIELLLILPAMLLELTPALSGMSTVNVSTILETRRAVGPAHVAERFTSGLRLQVSVPQSTTPSA